VEEEGGGSGGGGGGGGWEWMEAVVRGCGGDGPEPSGRVVDKEDETLLLLLLVDGVWCGFIGPGGRGRGGKKGERASKKKKKKNVLLPKLELT